MAERTICPLCGKENPAGLYETAAKCPVCGFPFAMTEFFADEKSRKAWEDLVRKSMPEGTEKLQAGDIQLVMHEEKLGLLNRKTYVYRCVTFAGRMTSRRGIRMVSAGPSHTVYLKDDGTLESEGDRSGGRCELEDLHGIVFVDASDENTYAVTENGSVIERGPDHFQSQMDGWKDIISTARGKNHIAALTKEGDVLFAGSILSPPEYQTAPAWKNIKQIAVCGDLTAGLREDGRVEVLGLRTSGDDRYLATLWRDIIAIVADSTFLYGLTRSGTIVMAGSCPSFLERGRREAIRWKNIIAIAGCRSGIAAIEENGTLHVAGGIREEMAEQISPFSDFDPGETREKKHENRIETAV